MKSELWLAVALGALCAPAWAGGSNYAYVRCEIGDMTSTRIQLDCRQARIKISYPRQGWSKGLDAARPGQVVEIWLEQGEIEALRRGRRT